MKRILSLILFLIPFITRAQLSEETDKKTGVLFPIENYSLKKYGYIDSTGVLRINFKYDYANEFENSVAYVRDNESDKDYIINLAGDKVCESIKNYFDGIAAFSINERWGFINNRGKIIKEAVYEEVSDFRNGHAAVKMNGKWGYINTLGNIVIPLMYDDHGFFNEGLAAVCLNKKYGFINISNKIVLPFIYKNAGSFREKIAPVMKDSSWGFIDRAGRLKIKYQYEDVVGFSESMCGVKLNDKWGFIDTVGNQIISFQYEYIYDSFRNGLARIKKDSTELFGTYINKMNEIICEDCSWLNYNDGLARVSKKISENILWGYVDIKGNIQISHQYKLTQDFGSNIGCAQLRNDKWIFINKNNENVFNTSFEVAGPFRFGLALIKKANGFYTYLNPAGQQKGQEFDYATDYYKGIAVVTLNNWSYLIDQHMNFLVKTKGNLSGQFLNGLAEVSYQVGDLKLNMQDGSITGDGEIYRGYVNRYGKEYLFLK